MGCKQMKFNETSFAKVSVRFFLIFLISSPSFASTGVVDGKEQSNEKNPDQAISKASPIRNEKLDEGKELVSPSPNPENRKTGAIRGNFFYMTPAESNDANHKFSEYLAYNNAILGSMVNALKGKKEQKVSLEPYQIGLITFGALGFLISCANIYIGFKNRGDDRKQSIVDKFWLREVLFPKMIKPLDEVLLESKYRTEDTTKLTEEDIDDLVKGLDDLRYKISFADLVSEGLMVRLEESLDDLVILIVTRSFPGDVFNVSEDSSSKNEAGDPFFNCYKLMLSHLINTHKNIDFKSF